MTPSATSENNLGVTRLIANLPSGRRFLRPPSTGRVGPWREAGFEWCRRFHSPPYHSVRRVFPSTAGRLAFQAAPFLVPHRLSQHPAYPAPHIGLHLPFVHPAAPPYVLHCVRTVASVMHCHARSHLLYPRGPRSGLGSIVPAHRHLIGLMRPTRRRIRISPHGGLYRMPSLCWCA